MIPGDLASRLRVMLETSVQPISVVHEIASELPRLQPGQRFTAQVQNPLPDGSFRALVAGQSIALSLPGSAKSGDILELVVTEQRGNTLHARQLPPQSATPDLADDLPRPVLSQAGQIISQLLTGRHGEARPLPLNQGMSLLPPNTPPQAATLAPVLQQALSQSGMFYESHLRQWVAGKRPLASLLQEPQSMLGPADNKPAEGRTLRAEGGLQPNRNPATLPENGESPESKTLPAASPSGNEALKAPSGRIADPLSPIVLQQLEAIASNQLSWQGQVWPGMQMQWSLLDPEHEGLSGGKDEEEFVWRSTLRVDLPHLGGVNARLLLGPQGLSVLIDTDSSRSAEQMRASQLQLQQALEAAGIPLRQLMVSENVRA